MKKAILFAVVAAVLLFTGCTTRLIDFTIISTKSIDMSRGAEFTRYGGRVEGEDSRAIIIVIPLGNPSMKEAIDRALESVPGAVALLDGVVISKFFYIPYIYGKSSYVVEGTPLIDPKLVGAVVDGDHILALMNDDGSVLETRYLSEEEYQTLRRKIFDS